MDIEKLYKENYSKYVNMIARILNGDRDTAEDIIQDAFERAIRLQNSYDPSIAPLETWMKSIIFNVFRDNGKSNRETLYRMDHEFQIEELEEELDLRNLPLNRRLVSENINKVDNEKHKRILHLFFMLGYSSSDIVNLEKGTTVTNVTTIASRFKEKMTQ